MKQFVATWIASLALAMLVGEIRVAKERERLAERDAAIEQLSNQLSQANEVVWILTEEERWQGR